MERDKDLPGYAIGGLAGKLHVTYLRVVCVYVYVYVDVDVGCGPNRGRHAEHPHIMRTCTYTVGWLVSRSVTPGVLPCPCAGGEEKKDFWPVVSKCTAALPEDKPRYLMGVGYPLDLVVCTALGVDMYDCVYPTRTARYAPSHSTSRWRRSRQFASWRLGC